VASEARRFRHSRNEGFVCERCGADVAPLAKGSCRNHCPQCLWSKHVDDVPGDRAAGCGGLMEPVAVEQDGRRGWMIVHRCTRCGMVRRNKAALTDPVQPDRLPVLLDVARHRSRQSGPGLASPRGHGTRGAGRKD
jgi:hypothetical protein